MVSGTRRRQVNVGRPGLTEGDRDHGDVSTKSEDSQGEERGEEEVSIEDEEEGPNPVRTLMDPSEKMVLKLDTVVW